MPTDAELLRQYVEGHDQKAFTELVQRHLNFVYASALRRIGGRHGLAEEIVQTVFTVLSRSAARLIDHPTLVGWLYQSTRNIAIDAVRSEQRREKLTQQLTTMPEDFSAGDAAAEWERVRPVIDSALDELKALDREIVLLRFFKNQTFGEIGAKLRLTENNARVRAGRALEKLRLLLASRGLTSTLALTALLAQEGLVAAPAELAASVTSAALAVPPASALVGAVSAAVIQKIGVAAVSAILAGGLASVVWGDLGDSVSDSELSALRGKNAQLVQLAGGTAASAVDKIVSQTTQILQRGGRNAQAKSAVAPSKYQNRGVSTPHNAFLTYVWAIDSSDATMLAKILSYDEQGTETIRGIYAKMPAAVKVQYATPEDLMVFFFLADNLLNPAPDPEVTEKFVATETSQGHAVLRPPGANSGGMDWVQTADGWKCVVPAGYCDALAGRILGNEMLSKLSAH